VRWKQEKKEINSPSIQHQEKLEQADTKLQHSLGDDKTAQRQPSTIALKERYLPAPTTTSQDTESSPQTRTIPLGRTRKCILHQRERTVLEIQSTVGEIIRPSDQVKETGTASDTKLPETWKNAAGAPSSFEKALDDVVQKLDDMRESGCAADPEMDRIKCWRGPLRQLSPSQRLQRAAELRRQRMAEAVVAPTLVVHEDKNINDKDVLKGLSIICAVSADAELDAWIQAKTGLRLRRSLADLKTFESLNRDWMVEDNVMARCTTRLRK